MLEKIKHISNWSIANPKKAIGLNIATAFALLLLVLIPIIFPSSNLSRLKIDTDPENMLSKSEPVRMFHNQMKKEFNLYDIIVLGIVNDTNKQGIFNKESLTKIYDLTQYAKTLDGVVSKELIAPSTVDSIESASKGVVNFNWLMQSPPADDKEAYDIYKKAARIPFLNGTLVSQDGKAIALYIPIKSKDLSYKTSKLLKAKALELGMTDDIYVTGLPIAQDQFGVEMFKQMAISAPLAMIFIFLLMYFFFRNVKLIISPMIVALLSVITTMGLLIVSGNTIHIMSSMIPIFIMPIAVLDAIHILSDFFEVYQKYSDKEKSINHVMDTLFQPMLYTSVTTVVGFASLAFTPIPPVQTFGIFVALGVAFAWVSTVTFIPAFIMLLNPKSLENFGVKGQENDVIETGKYLNWFGHKMSKYYKSVLITTIILLIVSIVGINKIVINDNPIRWFTANHEIRIADRALNERFAGTYMAYLTFDAQITKDVIVRSAIKNGISKDLIKGNTKSEIINNLLNFADNQEDADTWYDKIDNLENDLQVFKNPEVFAYIEDLQNYILKTGVVGKSNSIVDVVKTVYRDLYEGDESYFKIPDSSAAIAQTLITYQSSHRQSDLWHFVTPDYSKANIWIQLNSGDNQDMSKVIAAVDEFQKNRPAPFNIKTSWFGMTYINVVWQNKMVTGMMKAFIGSFLIVLLLMTILFRSIAWGALAMLPLTITIGAIYGIIGFIGKNYDMPIAVLSSLSLGLAVDYAIHFLARAKEIRKNNKDWESSLTPLFGEPARAIFRNVIVISVGFMPLLFAPLNSYITVGIFVSAILFFAGVVTLAVLPAMITMLQKWMFKDKNHGKFSLVSKISIILIILAIIAQNIMM
jgi:hypothetical protein